MTIGWRFIIAGLGTLLAAPALRAQVLPEPPEYRLRVDPETQQVHVRVELDIEEPTAIHLLFRGEWDGYPGLAIRLQRLEAYGPRGALAVEAKDEAIDSGQRRVVVDEPGLIIINYAMLMTPPAESRLYHRVSQLSSDGGHLIGRDLLPRIWLGRPAVGTHPAHIRIDGLPRNWSVATAGQRVRNSYAFDDIGAAVIVVGPLRTRRFNLGHRSLTAAIFGDWPVSDERIVSSIERIAGALHRTAGDGWERGDFILCAGRVPGAIRGLSTGGQVIGHTGIVYVGGNGPGEQEFGRWLHTTSHELTHWYIPTGFRYSGRPPSWFAEGFTDYFSLKILYAGGVIEADDFLREIGERMARFRSSPLYGVTSVAEAQADFWEDDSYRYIYDGGTAAAFVLDLGFQARRGSLENVLRELRGSGRLSDETLVAALASIQENEWLRAWLAGGLNPDWDAELARYRLRANGNSLISTDGWATEALSSIRP